MAFEGVSAGSEMFPQHPRSGDWQTLKGQMLAPHVAEPLEGHAMNNPRPGANSSMPDSPWTSEVLVSTGMTGGGGTMAH